MKAWLGLVNLLPRLCTVSDRAQPDKQSQQERNISGNCRACYNALPTYKAPPTSDAATWNPKSSSQERTITTRLKAHQHKLKLHKDRLKLYSLLVMRASYSKQSGPFKTDLNTHTWPSPCFISTRWVSGSATSICGSKLLLLKSYPPSLWESPL